MENKRFAVLFALLFSLPGNSISGVQLHYPSPNKASPPHSDCADCETSGRTSNKNERDEDLQGQGVDERTERNGQKPDDHFLEEKHDRVGWPSRRDDLSDQLSR